MKIPIKFTGRTVMIDAKWHDSSLAVHQSMRLGSNGVRPAGDGLWAVTSIRTGLRVTTAKDLERAIGFAVKWNATIGQILDDIAELEA
jgi:hypothetical protein